MLLSELITERWKKGHLTSTQLEQTIRHFVGNSGTVTKLSDDESKQHINAYLKIDIYLHEFLKRFSGERSVNRLMDLIFEIKSYEQRADELRNRHFNFDIKPEIKNLFDLEITTTKKQILSYTNFSPNQSRSFARLFLMDG